MNIGPYAEVSAIDEFDTALRALAQTAKLIETAEHPEVISDMLIVAVVASTESYFKRVLSALAGVCPVTMHNIASESVTIGAAASYPRPLLALATLEGALFSSKGVIGKQIRRFTRYDIAGNENVASAVSAFEVVCLTRHAAAHWRGHLDSRGARELGLQSAPDESYRISSNADLVQRSFAACDHMVHLINQVLFDHVCTLWIDAKHLSLERESYSSDNRKCKTLLAVFGSQGFCASSGLSPSALRKALIADADGE